MGNRIDSVIKVSIIFVSTKLFFHYQNYILKSTFFGKLPKPNPTTMAQASSSSSMQVENNNFETVDSDPTPTEILGLGLFFVAPPSKPTLQSVNDFANLFRGKAMAYYQIRDKLASLATKPVSHFADIKFKNLPKDFIDAVTATSLG